MLGQNEATMRSASQVLEDRETEDEFELNDILQFAAATVTDVAVSAADAITFGAFDLNTSDALYGMGAGLGLGEYYEKHQEGVQLASFLGGMVVPGMAAAKALKWARSSATPFRAMNSAKSKYTADAVNIMKLEGEASANYTQALRSARLWTAGEAAAESVVYEGAFYFFMKDHPYMEDYGMDDAALGVALGSILIPFRIAGLNKNVRGQNQENQVEQLVEMTLPANFAAQDAGTQVGILATRIQQAKDIDVVAAKLTPDQVAMQGAAIDRMGLKLMNHLNTMSSAALQKEAKFLVPKGGKPIKFTEYDGDVWDAPSWIEHLVKVSKDNPKSMIGIKKLGNFDPDDIAQVYLHATTDAASGVIGLPSAAAARRLLFTQQAAKVKTPDIGELLRNKPDGLEILEQGSSLTFTGTKKFGTVEKQWVADYLGLQHVKNKSVEFQGPVGKLVIDENALRSEGIMKNIELWHDAARPYHKVLDDLDSNVTGAAMHPMAEGHYLGLDEAASSQLFSSVKGQELNRGVRIEDGFKDDFLQLPSWKADRAWLDGINKVKNMPAQQPKDMVVEATDLPVLQGLINRVMRADSKAEWKTVIIKDGDKNVPINTVDEALILLNQGKAEILTRAAAEEFSTLQMAVMTNMPRKSVEEFFQQGRKFYNSDTMAYKLSDTKKYAGKKILHMYGDNALKGAHNELNAAIHLDEASALDIHKAQVETHVLATQVPEMVRILQEVVHSDMAKAVLDDLPQALTTFERKNHVWNSFDHMVRSLGPVGEHIQTMATNFNGIVNAHALRIKGGLTGSINALAADTVGANQFAMLRQTIHSFDINASSKFQYDSLRRVIVQEAADEATGTPEVLLKYYGTDQDIILNPAAARFMEDWLPVQKELLSLHNTSRAINSLPKTSGAGIWFPYDPVQTEFIAYKVGKKGEDISMVIGTSADDLAENLNRHRREPGAENFDFITRDGATDYWNQIHRYADLERITVSDIGKRKGGFTPGTVAPGGYEINRLMQSVTNDLWAKHRKIFQAANAPIFNQLDFMSKTAKEPALSSAGRIWQKRQAKVTNPEIVANALLGKSNLKNAPLLEGLNNMTNVLVNTALNSAGKAFQSFFGTNGGSLTQKGIENDWIKLSDELAAANVPNPWKDVHQFMEGLSKTKNVDRAQHRIAAAQSIMVNLNLRLFEISHAMVTAASIPVILTGELTHQGAPLAKTLMGAARMVGNSKHATPEAKEIMKIARERGYVEGVTSEVSNLMADLGTKPGFLTEHNPIIKALMTPSDLSERMARETAFAAGYLVTKEKWPNATKELLLSHSKSFMTRTMGNYNTKQKPTMFQGTFGVTVGLYQTFMLTMGQNIFRYAEAGDKKALMRLMTAQAGVFGIESLPMYNDFNTVLGEYVNEDHSDIRTTAYRVFGNSEEKSVGMANYVLFGLPSAALGAGVYTRGTLEPRSPLTFTGETGMTFKPAVMDAIVQAFDASTQMAVDVSRAGKYGGGFKDMQEAFLQGVSAQSIWRPGARMAELMMGKSFDRKGELISSEDEVYTPESFFSRIIGARPLREQAMRNLNFQNSYYEGVDRTNRQKATKALRRAASGGQQIDRNFLDGIHGEYMENGGSHNGWSQVYTGAYQSSSADPAQKLADYANEVPAMTEVSEMFRMK